MADKRLLEQLKETESPVTSRGEILPPPPGTTFSSLGNTLKKEKKPDLIESPVTSSGKAITPPPSPYVSTLGETLDVDEPENDFDYEAEDAVGKVITKALNNKAVIKPTKPKGGASKDDDSGEPKEPPLTYLQKRRKELGERRKTMLDIYQDNKDTRAWAEIAETFGQALTQWAAAKQGMKDNVDMSGIQFAKTDWVAKGDAALKELDMRMDEISKESSSIDRKEERDDSQEFSKAQAIASQTFQARQNKLSQANAYNIAKLREASSSGDKKRADEFRKEIRRDAGITKLMTTREKNFRLEYDDITKDLDKVLSTEGTLWDDTEGGKTAVNKSLTRLRNVSQGSPKAEKLIDDLAKDIEDKGIESFSDYREAHAKIVKEAHKSVYDPDIAATLYDRKTNTSSSSAADAPPASGKNEVVRMSNGKPAVFNADTREFIRWQ